MSRFMSPPFGKGRLGGISGFQSAQFRFPNSLYETVHTRSVIPACF